MKKALLPVLLIIILFAITLSTTMAADDGGGGGGGGNGGLNIENPLGETSDITTLVENILNFLWNLAFVIAPILIVYAGYLYLSSAGNEDKVKKAQKALIWAIVGFAVILIASGVPAIIQKLLSGEPEQSNEEPE